MIVEEYRQIIISQGFNPDDFEIDENGFRPKWYWENLQKAKQADKPIIEDINVTAETVVYTIEDVQMLADTVADLMQRVSELEARLEAMQNG